jgi:hypothetical protein
MSTQVTVTLPDKVYRRAERLAQLSGKDIEDVIAEQLVTTLPPLGSEMDARAVETLPDQEVVLLSESMMDEFHSARLSVLLDKNQNAALSASERAELELLMDVYSAGQLRKSQALAEAARRGLRPPLEP